MKPMSFKKIIAGLSFFACTSLSAAPLAVNVNGATASGEFGDARNTTMSFNVGANALITAIAFNVNLTAFEPSYLSEIGFFAGSSDANSGFNIFPLDQSAEPGLESYVDFIDLAALGFSFNVGADGILFLEFFEDFDDASVDPDSQWNGTITINVEAADVEEPGEVPEPSTTLLLGAGLAMMGYAGRRRRSAAKRAA